MILSFPAPWPVASVWATMSVANPGAIGQEHCAANTTSKTISDEVALQRANDFDDIYAHLGVPAFERIHILGEFHGVASSGFSTV
jgi:hypothetical protein